MPDTKTYTGLTVVMQALGPASPEARKPARQCKVSLTSLGAVEALLDWLENNGYDEREVGIVGDTFVVRWR
jgi:hypothetical protein